MFDMQTLMLEFLSIQAQDFIEDPDVLEEVTQIRHS